MTRIVFMGSPDFAVPSLRALNAAYQVAGVVTQPDRPAGRGRVLRPPAVKSEASRLGLQVLQPQKANAPDVLLQLQGWKPDLIVVAAFGQLLRPEVLNVPLHGCVNVHASLLPRWRGAAPIQAAIAAGDALTGVTIMKMDEGMDTGGILEQRETPVSVQDTAESLGERLAVIGAETLLHCLPPYLHGILKPQPQDSAKATKAPRLFRQDGLLDPMLPAENLARRVRAFQPWPGAYIAVEGTTLKVRRAHVVAASLGPGGRAVVENRPAWGTIEGALILDEVQSPGGKAMEGTEFLKGSRNWIA